MTEHPEKCAPSATIFTNKQTTTETISVKKKGETTDETSKTSCNEEKSSQRYATLIVKHPCIVLGFISLLVILSGGFSLIPQLGAHPLPDFNDPIKGFEARGTVISDRWRSQLNLFHDEQRGKITRVPPLCGIKNPSSKQEIGDAPAVCSKEQTFSQGKLTAKLVFSTKNGQNLLTAKNLKSICRLENKIFRNYSNFDDHCHKANGTHHCCPSWSVGNYIALLNGNVSCISIDETKVETARNLLQGCSKYYHKGALKPDCWDFTKNNKNPGRCNNVPKSCTRYNAVYNILHYLTDKSFLPDGPKPTTFLRYSLVLVPVKENKDFQVGIYKSCLKDGDLSDGNVELSGYEMSKLKYAIFKEHMITDLYLAGIAMFAVILILWVYTRSFVITSLVGLIVVSSLIIAYFIYTKVLAIQFFPFLNILTSVFLVGIAADDAFVYMDIWNQIARKHRAKLGQPSSNQDERGQELICISADTIKHASLSMFVTSFTTSAAFFASLTSEITSIRLFGIYSGLSVLCMFFLMVTWFPAVVILERTVFSRFNCCFTFCRKFQETEIKRTCSIKRVVDKLKVWHTIFFTNLLPQIVVKLRYFSVVFLFLVAVGSIVISTVKPGLQLPSSQDFKMFRESHALEKYPLKLKKNFHFETTKRTSFSVNLIWGIKATDTGDQFDPRDTGSLIWDRDFDIVNKESQQWIVNFTSRLKQQAFVASDTNPSFIEEFFNYMRTNCTNSSKICCTDSKFPYSSSILSECLQRMQCQKIKAVQFSGKSIAGGAPLFDTKSGRLRALSIKLESTVPFTWSYDPADRFWAEAEDWVHEEFNGAPSSVNGWFISELKFYDLQKSLSKGTFISMSISLAVAFGVMLVTTGNVYISVFATVTITCALGVTVGSLVLMGWKLNILESITLSVAVGLSVDFALHYGVAYVLAMDKADRKSRVSVSMIDMSSAISMAAFTTFLTGAIATQSVVLSYIQMGQFLMIIMSVSWVYATFFFQALCSILGPENDTGQIMLYKFKAWYMRLKASLCCLKEVGTEERNSVRVSYLNERREIVHESQRRASDKA